MTFFEIFCCSIAVSKLEPTSERCEDTINKSSIFDILQGCFPKNLNFDEFSKIFFSIFVILKIKLLSFFKILYLNKFFIFVCDPMYLEENISCENKVIFSPKIVPTVKKSKKNPIKKKTSLSLPDGLSFF